MQPRLATNSSFSQRWPWISGPPPFPKFQNYSCVPSCPVCVVPGWGPRASCIRGQPSANWAPGPPYWHPGPPQSFLPLIDISWTRFYVVKSSLAVVWGSSLTTSHFTSFTTVCVMSLLQTDTRGADHLLPFKFSDRDVPTSQLMPHCCFIWACWLKGHPQLDGHWPVLTT